MTTSVEIQTAVADLGQVDILLEMVVKCLVRDPALIHDTEWYAKLESAMHLLEATYREKKDALVRAVERGR